jgi:hypothetical protein
VVLLPRPVAGFFSVPLSAFTSFLGRSGEGASSFHEKLVAGRDDLPYVAILLRRSAVVKADDMAVAMRGRLVNGVDSGRVTSRAWRREI